MEIWEVKWLLFPMAGFILGYVAGRFKRRQA